jgi:hypothetical protein
MSRSLASVLKTDSLKPLAQILRSKGRKGDTILAHISPKEAAKLKREGGSGTINPDTGLPEFFDGEDFFGGFGDTSSFTTAPAPTQTFEAPVGSAMIYDQPAGPSLAEATYGPTYSEAPLTTNIAGAPGYGASASPGSFYGFPGGTSADGTFSQSAFMQNATAGSPYYGQPITSPTSSPEAIANAIAAAGGGVGGGAAPTSIDAPGASTKAADTSEKGLFGDLISNKNALGLGILGAGGLMGYMNQQKAADQAKKAAAQIQAAYAAAAQQQKDLAAPLTGPGYTQLSQALQGTLSPANQQAMQAAQARVAQASAKSGGVGAVQASLQEEAFRQQLLGQQQQQALALLAPGNAMIQAAINAQLQGTTQSLSTRLGLEQQANNAAMGLYAALGSAVGGGLMKGA